MLITGVTLTQFTSATELASDAIYERNVIVARDGRDTGRLVSRNECRARLAVRDSRGPGSRLARSGRRHGPYACWHAYRDVLDLMFTRYPNATVRAGNAWHVTYRGQDGFRELYPETAVINIGTAMSPRTMPDLCVCEGPAITWEARELRNSIGLLSCPLDRTGENALIGCGLFSTPGSLAAHTRARHGIEPHEAELDSSEERARRVAAYLRAKKAEENEFLMNDPVFGPRLTPGTRFGVH